jgi:hypothetical protein
MVYCSWFCDAADVAGKAPTKNKNFQTLS